MSITFGSLFSGIGGIDLGLERAGMVCKWQVEIDDYANKVLERHWPGVKRYRDVRDVGAHNLEPVDLICGGFPCQDVSLAGKRAGLQGKRSTLWGEFARIIRELRSGWVLAENVPGLLSSDKGLFFGQVLRDLAESGYDAEWQVLPAAALGAPHKRDRVWLVAYRGARGCEVSPTCLCQNVADAECERRELGRAGMWQAQDRKVFDLRTTDGGQSMADAALSDGSVASAERGQGAQGRRKTETAGSGSRAAGNQWATEPNVGRVAHGIPARVDRLKCLGNAVVPQVAEWVGRRILGATLPEISEEIKLFVTNRPPETDDDLRWAEERLLEAACLAI